MILVLIPCLLTHSGRTSSDYRKAVGLRELSAISSMIPLPRQTIMICGPGLYRPEAAKKSSAIESYLRVYDALIPNDPIITAPFLWHNDLHEENIFVDPENPTKIVSIIDWQSNDLLPLFDHNPDPAFIQYSGPKPDTLDPPELEDTSNMSKEERARAISDYFDKALFIASRKIASKKTPAVYRTIAYQQTEAFDILTIARRIFEYGEAHLHALMVELRNAWPGLPLVEESSSPIPFPIDIDDARVAEIEDDGEKAVHSIQIMNEFKARLGPLWPDKDAVSHEQYDETKAALRELKAEVIAEFARSEGDRLEFERLWPFDD